eukprot:s16162_g1.t1
MAEIRATVFPDFEGPRKIPVHGTRGTIGSRGCFEVYFGGREELHFSHLGSPRSPGTAGAARASAGCLASERFRGAGHLGRLRSGCAWLASFADGGISLDRDVTVAAASTWRRLELVQQAALAVHVEHRGLAPDAEMPVIASKSESTS